MVVVAVTVGGRGDGTARWRAADAHPCREKAGRGEGNIKTGMREKPRVRPPRRVRVVMVAVAVGGPPWATVRPGGRPFLREEGRET